MAHTIRVTGPARPQVVWERYADLDAWSSWAPHLSGVRCEVDRLATGITGTVLGPGGLPLPFEILEVDQRAMTWSWRVGYGPLRVRLSHGVEAKDEGSRTSLTLHVPWPVALPYVPLARWAMSRLVAA